MIITPHLGIGDLLIVKMKQTFFLKILKHQKKL